MKTPREILLERHRSAAPKLDAIRRVVVAEEMNHQDAKAQSIPVFCVSWCLRCSDLLWRELILPSRRIWTALAAVWILLLAANFSLHDHSPTGVMASASSEMILSFQQQERLLTELIGPNETRAAAPPKPFSPQPSSERRLEILLT